MKTTDKLPRIKRTMRVVPGGAEPSLKSLQKKGYVIRDCYLWETREDGKDVYVVKYQSN